ncbi:META domain-containing protein [Clavibacter michiganensis subsp. michiganensis]|nr:META domain-containing protein [Clavibacter michiganensis subsp. michiganensis]MWJ10444.1 META domain-containing protein [Clavibacter michiganensis subsp. michiganensis]MWJ21972.1 META domain-containing protein [Clavibacter michiganensis subsp. michiganensis]MWJ43663.1 META domain-containing protein [Clavibacter michiganensis subsp. michiganensis]QIT11307.1 META domain-containing protein [Clavibacter michiganensis subsp. michiganensis]
MTPMPTAARIPARRRSWRPRGAAVAALAALALVPLVGCAPVSDVRGNWHLVAGSDSSGDLGVGDTLITMRVGGGEVSGRGPCNDYSGRMAERGDGMLSAAAPGTLPCEDGGLEARYFQDLAVVSSLQVDDGHLVATGPDDVRLEYAERSRG